MWMEEIEIASLRWEGREVGTGSLSCAKTIGGFSWVSL